MEFHDRVKALRSDPGERTALSQLLSHVKGLEKRFKKYGAAVTWAPYGETAQSA